jgi:hypothetical protein
VSKADISFQRSTDGGQHWSDAQSLSVDGSLEPNRRYKVVGATPALAATSSMPVARMPFQ